MPRVTHLLSLLAVLLFPNAQVVAAFMLSTQSSRQLQLNVGARKFNEERGSERQDVKKVLRNLEKDLSTPETKSQVFPSSTTSRKRCELEIDLLNTLYDSDEGIDELMHLWITGEGDEASAKTILSMEKNCSENMESEEAALRDMMARHPTWAEPAARLAVLCFYKGRTREAYVLSREALGRKPWHFELYPLLVVLSLRHNDMKQALRWARAGLPSLRNLRRRREWVHVAVRSAREHMTHSQRRVAEKYYQKSMAEDTHASGTPPNAWQ